LWLLFVAYWAVAAVGVKRSAGRRPWRREIGLRLVVMLLIVALCLLGFSLAINARRHLGRNWGLPMSRKEQSELVTSGPYLVLLFWY
jgi:protein-S-isoprenylcysteine O-methyltransferase Ste14